MKSISLRPLILSVAISALSCGSGNGFFPDEVCDEIVGETFTSELEQVCWGNPIMYCHWWIRFEESSFEWKTGDTTETGEYICLHGEIESTHRGAGSEYSGTYDPDSGELLWEYATYIISK